MSQTNTVEKHESSMPNTTEKTLLKCGIIMPIAQMDGYTESHWQDVKNIIIEATQELKEYTFHTEIVSNSDGEINIIHKNIISNLYNSDVVVCDISGRNPNVLFELGMRLTFDKPTIIIKDDLTDYIFDTSSIETLTYPKDLRFGSIVRFKETLSLRIKKTYEMSIADKDYSPFLGHFGEFKVTELKQTPISDVQQIILNEVSALRSEIKNIKKDVISPRKSKLKMIPANLENIIYNYVEDTKDFSPTSDIIIKEEFMNYLQTKNIDYFNVPEEILVKYLNRAQDDVLPF